jgi:hypothetical protein
MTEHCDFREAAAKVLDGRRGGGACRPASTPRSPRHEAAPPQPRPEHYKVICFSLYTRTWRT